MRLLSEVRNYMGNYHVKSGVYHAYRGEYAQAVNFLCKALADGSTLGARDRRNARSHLTLALKGLAEKLAAEGRVEAGVEHLRRAMEIDSKYPDIPFLLGRLLERMGERGEAIAAYRDAVALYPGYLEAQVALGDCLLAAGRPDEAAAVYRVAMELKLEQMQDPFRRGIRSLEQGEVAEAREYFHEAFRAVPQLSKEYLTKAVDHLRAEENEKALVELDRAIELNPKYPDLHNFRGIALCGLERYDESFAAFRRSSALRPGHAVPRLNLAFAYLRAGRLDEGEAEFEAILERDPGEPIALARLEELRTHRAADKRGLGVRS